MKATPKDMRDWLTDCGADPDDLETRDDIEVTREVDRHYDGGVRQMERDLVPVSVNVSPRGYVRGEVIA